ncbi:SMI1/KNR4 family protein [Campylobacter sp.]|uniref:SMI1/KNR4 family protein n=1 Tax=Campylobacter sp. TaxID=205 RepID=UPI002A813180|nr:SMI1/KNR4 family protein [Campylobacter sp.]MDY4446074.1 SMI1/KNR4 family protein [Campylobacter sp.]
MNSLLKKIEAKSKIYTAKPCTDLMIVEAERKLGLSFSDEYRDYLRNYGALSFLSYEFTGLGVDDYIDVVEVTKRERELNNNFPKDAIVIEDTGLESLLILQNTEGNIFEYRLGKQKKIYNSFKEYLNSLIK